MKTLFILLISDAIILPILGLLYDIIMVRVVFSSSFTSLISLVVDDVLIVIASIILINHVVRIIYSVFNRTLIILKNFRVPGPPNTIHSSHYLLHRGFIFLSHSIPYPVCKLIIICIKVNIQRRLELNFLRPFTIFEYLV